MKYTSRVLARTTALMAAAAFSAAVSAHAIWFAQRVGELALVSGPGAEDLSVIRRLDKVTSVGGVDDAGRPVAVSLKRSDHLAFVNLDNAPAIVTATLDNGWWSQGADGQWVGKGKDEVPGAKTSGRYLKYSTHLRTLPKGEVKPVVGLTFQIVPVGNHFSQHMGDALTLRVLLDGKPAVGAKVWSDAVNDPDAKPVAVAPDGSVTLKVRNQGLNVIKAELDTLPSDPRKADKTEQTATLSFVLAHVPE